MKRQDFIEGLQEASRDPRQEPSIYDPYGNAGTYAGTLAEMVKCVRWLTGRALVQRYSELRHRRLPSGLYAPDSYNEHAERDHKWHRGKLLAYGPPGRERDGLGPIIPWDCAPGDDVFYVYAVAMQKLRTFDVEGLELVVVAQAEILAAITPDFALDPPETEYDDEPACP